MNTRVLRAVFKRNFIGYFANPTGYVFICVFVLLGSIAAFLPDEFFNKNLANLDQLITWFPLIMLVFVPAVTMGIWADERRQGTDELLLTIPAGDFEVVIGKFLAAVGILSASLVFSFVSNLTILYQLGNPDVGLFICTYLGFWLIGVMMVATGMVASFLTGNLTIAYLLGALFNAPFVAAQWTYVLPVSGKLADAVKNFSIESQFAAFGRGILSLSGVMYFVSISVVMLYLCMVLISRRHWSASQTFHGGAHYLARGVSLLLIAFYLCVIVQRFDLRYDMTEEKLSTLSKATLQLLDSLDPNYPVSIEAFVSPSVPDDYVKTQLDILTLLKEIETRGKGKVATRIHRIEPFTKDAMLAEERFGIVPQTVLHMKRGVPQPERVYLAVTMSSGLNTVRLPFIDRGQSVEYELVRAVCNVTAQEKKRIGILKTDAKVMGDFDFRAMRPPMPWPVIDDLSQQYVVSEVDPQMPILEKYDVVLAVQPSSLGMNEMINFTDMVRRGQPTLIFEDPLPFLFPDVVGTEDPKMMGGSSQMSLYSQPIPKGNLQPLWDMLGVEFNTRRIPCPDYNPVRGYAAKMPPEFLFLAYDPNKPEDRKNRPFSKNDETTRQLRHVLMPFAGSIDVVKKPDFKVSPLIWTTRANGYVNRVDVFPMGRIGFGSRMMQPDENRITIKDPNQFDLAVRIEGEMPPLVQQTPGENADAQGDAKAASTKINVILVADLDMITPVFYAIQRQGADPRLGTNFSFDNVAFIMNAIDSLAGDDRFLSVRGRRPEHRALDKFDEMTRVIKEYESTQREQAQKKFNETKEAAQKAMQANVEKLALELQGDTSRLTTPELIAHVKAMEMAGQKKLEADMEKQQQELNRTLDNLEMQRQEELQYQQGIIKALAIMIPPTPLLILASIVFFWRGMRETTGASKTRLRSGKK